MKLVNIYNERKIIYLFTRENGELKITKDKSFYPYFFEPAVSGKFTGFDGTQLKKVFCSNPAELRKRRSPKSFESDVFYTKRYLIDKVDSIEKTEPKYCFIDIENLTDDLPDVSKAEKPVSCISVYNSYTKEITTFFLGDYDKEYNMINDFIKYMQKEKFDIWFSWNVDYDYNYLANRFPDFAERISPINRTRYGSKKYNYYPAGISIVDYLSLFRKVYMREFSYALDYIAEKHLGKGKEYKPDFSKLTEDIRKRNREDVDIMRKLEEKHKIIEYFDEIRRFAIVEWEDLVYNSRIIENLLFKEAKKKNIILPNKKKGRKGKTFRGATRDAKKTGLSYNVGKYDLSGAYPQAIIDFCLDASNIIDNDGIEIEGTNFKQNKSTLLPTITQKLLSEKNKLKKIKNKTNPESVEYKDVSIKYNARKGLVNSAFGSFGNKYFRLYNNQVAGAITFLVRDVLLYVIEELEKMGIKVLYYDTDSVFIDSKENLVDVLNDLVQQWAREKFNKDEVNIKFDFEGIFEKLLIITTCRYKGYLKTENGIKEEVKGIETKRSDSTVYMKKFQNELIEKILDGKNKEEVSKWIKEEMEKIKQLPIEEVGFPCKIQRKEYKNVPIFLRALNNSKEYGFDVTIGEPYYYIYVIPEKRDSDGKDVDVLAFNKENKDFVKNINWYEVIRRNIIMKVDTIYDAMGWEFDIYLEKPKKLLKRKNPTKKKIKIEKDPNQMKLF